MSSPGFNPDSWHDAELRAVRMPDGLLERLRWVALADDEELDTAIRDVSVPMRLSRWLRQPALDTDEGLDAALRDIPVSVAWPDQWRQVATNWSRLARVIQWAAAASLLLAIGLSYFGAMIGFLVAAYRYSGETSGPELIASPTAAFVSRAAPAAPDSSAAILGGSSRPPQGPSAASPTPVPEVKLVNLDRPRPAIGGAPGVFHRIGGLAEWSEPFDGKTHAELFLNVAMHRWGVFPAHPQFDELPELKLVAGLIPRGIDWPLVPGSNPHILLQYGVHPFVSPAAHPQLRSGLVPLGVGASSYELTRRYLEDGRLPPPDVVRAEEFLAAVDYEFPPPKGQALGLSTAAGPSPFGGPDLRLMQIGVQARQQQTNEHPPMYLILAVDVSASMRWGGRLAMIRRQSGELVGRLEPGDRVSLITFSEDARVLAEEAGPNEWEQLLAVLKLLSVQSSTNVGAGLREAYALARRGAALRPTGARVVLLTDGLAEFGPGTAEKIQQQLADAAGRGVSLDVIDLGQEREADPQLASFARAGCGRVYRATNGDQLRWALLEIVSGRPQLVAADARLKLTFNPDAILEYRLLGHEAKAMAGLMPAHPETDFHAGQSATALYEIRLRPSGPQEVATVELTWREPGGGKSQLVSTTVRRGQFGSSFVEAPLSLQQAALVAEVAEVLRQSPYASSSSDSPSLGLARVLQLAGQVDTRLRQRPTFVEFISLVQQAEKAKPYRRR